MNRSGWALFALFGSSFLAGCAVPAAEPSSGEPTASESNELSTLPVAARHHARCADNAACAPGEQCQLPPHGHAAGTCAAQPTCAQVTASDGRFLAKNFAAGHYADADAWARANAGGGAYGISLATCDVVAHGTTCLEIYKPVCGVSQGAKTYGNDCSYRSAVTAAAGKYGEAFAKAIDGECAEPGAPVCAAYSLDTAGATSSTYYASNWNSADEASAFLSLHPAASEPNVLTGACSSFTICNKLYRPVCGAVHGEAARTYANRCELEVAIRGAAGAEGASKGRYAQGACAN